MVTSKSYRKAIAEILKAMGYQSIAKDVLKSKLKQTKDAVNNIVIREYSVGKGCEFLTDPITRKKTKNPLRPKYKKAVVLVREAYRRGIDLEKKEENKK